MYNSNNHTDTEKIGYYRPIIGEKLNSTMEEKSPEKIVKACVKINAIQSVSGTMNGNVKSSV